jgi:hypothetical protein
LLARFHRVPVAGQTRPSEVEIRGAEITLRAPALSKRKALSP